MQEIGIEKTEKVLKWTSKQGWSTPSIIDNLGGGGRGLCARLIRHGLLTAKKTATGAIAGFPAKFVRVTPLGMTMVHNDSTESESETVSLKSKKKSKKEKDPTPQNLRHDVLVQKITLNILANSSEYTAGIRLLLVTGDQMMSENGIFRPFQFGNINSPLHLDYSTSAEIKLKNLPGKKSDTEVIWSSVDEYCGYFVVQDWRIELEISPKRGEKLHTHIQLICEMLMRDENVYFASCFIDPDLLQKYKLAFDKDTIPLYARTEADRLYALDQRFEITQDMRNAIDTRVAFILIEQTGSNPAATSIVS